jgi:hypothetical protein
MNEGLDAVEILEPAELRDEMLDLVSGGSFPGLDPNG